MVLLCLYLCVFNLYSFVLIWGVFWSPVWRIYSARISVMPVTLQLQKIRCAFTEVLGSIFWWLFKGLIFHWALWLWLCEVNRPEAHLWSSLTFSNRSLQASAFVRDMFAQWLGIRVHMVSNFHQAFLIHLLVMSKDDRRC